MSQEGSIPPLLPCAPPFDPNALPVSIILERTTNGFAITVANLHDDADMLPFLRVSLGPVTKATCLRIGSGDLPESFELSSFNGLFIENPVEMTCVSFRPSSSESGKYDLILRFHRELTAGEIRTQNFLYSGYDAGTTLRAAVECFRPESTLDDATQRQVQNSYLCSLTNDACCTSIVSETLAL